MKTLFVFAAVAAAPGVMFMGCGRSPAVPDVSHSHGPHSHDDAAIRQALAALSPEDRKLAEEQGYCANELDSKLGSMGTPLKVMVHGRPVFVCCEDCSKRVSANPEQTLATVDRLRAKTADEKH